MLSVNNHHHERASAKANSLAEALKQWLSQTNVDAVAGFLLVKKKGGVFVFWPSRLLVGQVGIQQGRLFPTVLLCHTWKSCYTHWC